MCNIIWPQLPFCVTLQELGSYRLFGKPFIDIQSDFLRQLQIGPNKILTKYSTKSNIPY